MQSVLRNRGIYARPVRVHRKILGRCSGGVPRYRASSRAECPAGIWEVCNLDAGNAFATRLNEGLEIDPAEAERIITGSILDASEVLRAADSPAHECGRVHRPIAGNRLRVEFMLAKLDIAVTFCHIAHSSPSQHANRLLRKARNALFDGMHFVCGSELAAYESKAIAERLAKLHAELEITVSSIVEEWSLTAGDRQRIPFIK